MRKAILLLGVMGWLVAGPAAAERRVALVLGNGNYAHAVKLPNPSEDAEAMARLLRSKGFEVVLGTDLGRDAMAEKLSAFAHVSGGAEVALFFYAGHGMQLAGRNYLVPVDAQLKSELDVKVRTIDIESVLQDTMADAKVKLVILDACRDNPFAKQIVAAAPKTRSVAIGAGLAEMKPGEGTLIAFATGPGQVAIDGEGRHSPFTRALLKHLEVPNLEIRHALTQVRAQVAEETRKQQLPWENTNLTGYFYMAKADAAAAPPLAAAVAPAAAGSGFDPRVMEIELWSAVKSSRSVDEYKAYLEKYPNGTFADLARSRIAAITRGTPADAKEPDQGEIRTAEASAATEDALGLDQEAWIAIQTRLTGLGFATRGTDGRVGNGTRRGITAWQSARGYPATGHLNKLQREALLRETVPTTRSTASSSGGETGSVERPARRRSSEGSGGSIDPGAAGAAGAFVGGVVRGAIGRKLPF